MFNLNRTIFIFLFLTNGINPVSNNRNPFSYGIADQFALKAIGKIENNNSICALITLNNRKYQVRVNDFFCEKYQIVEISDKQILIKDIFDNQYRLKIDL